MSGAIGKLFPTDYTEADILICVSDYKIITGHNQPSRVFVPLAQAQAVKWLAEFDIEITTDKIQPGTILLVG